MNHCLSFTLKTDNSILCIENNKEIGWIFTLVYLLNKLSLISAYSVVSFVKLRHIFSVRYRNLTLRNMELYSITRTNIIRNQF